MQLRAQLRRTPCQMYRVTSASESSGGRLARAEVAFLYASDRGGFPLRSHSMRSLNHCLLEERGPGDSSL